MKEIYRKLEKHYVRFFKGHKHDEMSWLEGPLLSHIPNFKVIRFGPGPKSTLWTYLSLGAWEVEHCRTHRLEFFYTVKEPDDCHVEYLAMLAYYHMNHHLGIGHTCPFGRPWLPGSTLDHVLLSLPYTFGPALEEFKHDGVEIQVLWALPISEDEKRFRHDVGLEELEVLFETCDLDYWNPQRASVVPQ